MVIRQEVCFYALRRVVLIGAEQEEKSSSKLSSAVYVLCRLKAKMDWSNHRVVLYTTRVAGDLDL